MAEGTRPNRGDAPTEDVAALRARLEAALGEIDGYLSERERLERELSDTNRGVVALYAELDDKAEQLRRADAAKSRFLSGVSHELRTPLNSILALCRLLLDHTDGPLTSEQERQVGYVRQSAEDLLGLVNGLLDLSRIEAGRTELSIEEFDLGHLFRRLEGEMQPLLRDREVDLVFELSRPEVACTTDQGKLAQIVRNFVSNALKYTERGEIRVIASCDRDGDVAREAAAPRPDTRADGRSVRISVADTGIGIDPADQDRIFDEFTQLPGPLQARGKGTGLGLPLSRALARALGGRVGVASEAGAGSTFWVEVPLRHPAALAGPVSETETPPRPKPAPTTAHVLVVDDDPVTRYVVGQMLRAEGFAVTHAAGGIDGLAKARSLRPDLIILDLSMPDLDGNAVVEQLKAEPATDSIPVVVYSAQELLPDERARLGSLVEAIVSKGGDVNADLRAAVRMYGRRPTTDKAVSTRRQR